MKKRLTTALLAGAMAASMAMPAMADPSPGGAVPAPTGTEVWAGIVIEDIDAKIKVEVPTLFAFVVKGTTDPAATGGVSSTAGDIYLPNVKVKVTTPSTDALGNPQTAVFELQTEGNLVEEGKLPFTNYSTKKDSGASTRSGLEVTINGNIKNEGTPESRKYWTHTTSDHTNPVAADFKNYNVSIDGNKFDTVAANGGLQMTGSGITLTAPNTNLGGSQANLDASNYTSIGETYYAPFDVLVGGEKKAYSQVEESAKIGTIVWTISAEIVKAGVDTAPDMPYLP